MLLKLGSSVNSPVILFGGEAKAEMTAVGKQFKPKQQLCYSLVMQQQPLLHD